MTAAARQYQNSTAAKAIHRDHSRVPGMRACDSALPSHAHPQGAPGRLFPFAGHGTLLGGGEEQGKANETNMRSALERLL